MGKKWQELEFLDYKERQVRRRANKKKKLLEEGANNSVQAAAVDEKSMQLKILFFGFVACLFVSIYFVYLRSGSASVSGQGLKVVRVQGDVVVSGRLNEWKATKAEPIPEDVTVVTGKDGKVELETSIPGTTIILFENSRLTFDGLNVDRTTDEFQLDMEIEKGSAIFEFQNKKGAGIFHCRTPQKVDLWGKLVYLKVISSEEGTKIIVADGFVKAEAMGEKTIIPGDRQMISSEEQPIGTPRAVNVIREVWNW